MNHDHDDPPLCSSHSATSSAGSSSSGGGGVEGRPHLHPRLQPHRDVTGGGEAIVGEHGSSSGGSGVMGNALHHHHAHHRTRAVRGYGGNGGCGDDAAGGGGRRRGDTGRHRQRGLVGHGGSQSGGGSSSDGGHRGSSVVGGGGGSQQQGATIATGRRLTAETAAAVPPPGLSGPSSFCFSPSPPGEDGARGGDAEGGRYLSFLSSSSALHLQQPSIGGAAGAANGGRHLSSASRLNGAAAAAAAAAAANERRLYVVDLAPFLADRRRDEENDRGSAAGPDQDQDGPVAEITETDGGVQKKSNNDPQTAAEAAAAAKYKVQPLLSVGGTPASSTRSSFSAAAPQMPTARGDRQHAAGTATTIEGESESTVSLEERLRRERQRLHGSGFTQFGWAARPHRVSGGRQRGTAVVADGGDNDANNGARDDEGGDNLRILVPLRGNLYVQDGVGPDAPSPLRLVYDKSTLEGCLSSRGRRDRRRLGGEDAQQWQRRRRRGNGRRSLSGDSSCRVRTAKGRWRDPPRSEGGVGNGDKRQRRNGADGDCDGIGRGKRGSSSSSRGGHRWSGARRGGGGGVVGRDAGAIDPQLSPDGSMVAFVVAGEIYVLSCGGGDNNDDDVMDIDDVDGDGGGGGGGGTGMTLVPPSIPVRLTFGAVTDGSGDDDEEDDSDSEYDDDSERNSGRRRRCEDEINGGIDADAEPLSDCLSPMEDDEGRDPPDLDPSFHGGVNLNPRPPRGGRHVTHGLADFVAQEEMDRYRGFWWDDDSSGILFARVDESMVPPYRITHEGRDSAAGGGREAVYEDHRYPFAGEANPAVRLGYVRVDRATVLGCKCSKMAHAAEVGGSEEDMSEMEDEEEENHKVDLPDESSGFADASTIALANWSAARWFDPPTSAPEYLARVSWFPDGTACAQWQNRAQSVLQLVRMNVHTGDCFVIHTERSDVWINLHHMLRVLPRPVHPDECHPVPMRQTRRGETPKCIPRPLPEGSFSFLFASERTGYSHLYLYTYVAGDDSATLVRAVSGGKWVVESIVGVDMDNDVVYVTGTYDSPLERHLYALPLTNQHAAAVGIEEDSGDKAPGGGSSVRRGLKHVMNSLSGGNKSLPTPPRATCANTLWKNGVLLSPPPEPFRLTLDSGMHSIVMDDACRILVDTSSDLERPTSSRVFALPHVGLFDASTITDKEADDGDTVLDGRDKDRRLELLFVLYDANFDEKLLALEMCSNAFGGANALVPGMVGLGFPPPEILSFPTTDGSEILHAAVYRPDPTIHGPGPYPLICAVYGGPHVQRVNRSWSQCADMRAQRLCSLGFAIVKCDNRGSSRRGVAFESAIRGRLGRLEVLDQVCAVRHLAMRGIADTSRVGIYGWSYGGYLAAMCLSRAPDVFHVAVAGAPVTSWDGYDTHYTERYMQQPFENPEGYRESAVFDHVPNMRGKLMIVHGLIDENVHFRHTARLINRLIAAGKDYDLLIFPNERHSPRRLRDRVYMEKRISDYFVRNLGSDVKSIYDELNALNGSPNEGGMGTPGALGPLAGRL